MCAEVGAEDYHQRYFVPAARALTAMTIESFVLAAKSTSVATEQAG